MRSIKSVIILSGQLKKSQKEFSEQQLVVNALYLINQPKLTPTDFFIFKGILNDMFPGIQAKNQVQKVIENEIR